MIPCPVRITTIFIWPAHTKAVRPTRASWNGNSWIDDYKDVGQEIIDSVRQSGQSGTKASSSTNQTLLLIAFILNVLTCVGFAIALFPLLWMVPMTVHSWKIYKGETASTTTFNVCTLLFLNLISGILLLIATDNA